MDRYEREMIDVVNFNHYIRTLTDNLNAISARRKNSRSIFRRKRK